MREILVTLAGTFALGACFSFWVGFGLLFTPFVLPGLLMFFGFLVLFLCSLIVGVAGGCADPPTRIRWGRPTGSKKRR